MLPGRCSTAFVLELLVDNTRTKEYQMDVEKKEIHHSLLIPSVPSYSFIDHYYVFFQTFSSQIEEILPSLVTHYKEIQNSFHMLTASVHKAH